MMGRGDDYCGPVTMILVQNPEHVQLMSTANSDGAYQIDNSLAGLEQFMLVVELLSSANKHWQTLIHHTSKSLKAARLLSPCTRASRAKKSLPWRDFHLVDDEEEA
jgi:hypothetical protein